VLFAQKILSVRLYAYQFSVSSWCCYQCLCGAVSICC